LFRRLLPFYSYQGCDELAAHNKLSDVRLRKHNSRIKLGQAVEAASYHVISREVALNQTGDVYLGTLPRSARFLGGTITQFADEGTDGTATIEVWDDMAGSTQTAISSSTAIDAGAAGQNDITALATGAEDIDIASDGAIIVANQGAVSNAVNGVYELYFSFTEYESRKAA